MLSKCFTLSKIDMSRIYIELSINIDAFAVQMVHPDALEEQQNTFRVIHKIVQKASQIFVINSVQILMKRHSKEFVMNGCHI